MLERADEPATSSGKCARDTFASSLLFGWCVSREARAHEPTGERTRPAAGSMARTRTQSQNSNWVRAKFAGSEPVERSDLAKGSERASRREEAVVKEPNGNQVRAVRGTKVARWH